MLNKLIIGILSIVPVFFSVKAMAQVQACPVNLNFGEKTINNWFAYTGTFQSGSSRTPSVKQDYPAGIAYPQGTMGAVSISEYGLSSLSGIQVNTIAATDVFGGFSSIPNINGYQYDYSILLGSTNVASNPGGYFRGIGYEINVPLGTGPYTMTYAYAMVLENGSHVDIQQPLASATLMTNDSVITCASPQYFLPTNAGVLDVTTAARNGFKLSNVPTPNTVRNNETPYRVWTKDWTEVTFDLEPYRGKKVTLTFAAENCVPRGHFAYAYIALRNDCNGLMISGNKNACINGPTYYSIPELTGATYQWTVPSGWKITSDPNSNIITVIPGPLGGFITAKEQNSCANLEAVIQVTSSPPTVAGKLIGANTVCDGFNNSPMQLSGNIGNILKWISSTNGINWTDIANTTNNYIAQNLNSTTQFKALVQNGPACSIDSAIGVTIIVNTKSIGGNLTPNNLQICQDQNKDAVLKLLNYKGFILNWQSSMDAINWNNFSPAKTDSLYNIVGLLTPRTFRVIVKNGVCIPDTSTIASVGIFSEKFPKATFSPNDTAICFGSSVALNATISIGTSYVWNNPSVLLNPGNGTITALPFAINAKAAPARTTNYILSIKNGNCPNLLIDTFRIAVIAPIIINAGRDTAVVVNQPLQLAAKTNNDSANLAFVWRPSTGLNNATISNPIARLNGANKTMQYVVRATSTEGCFAEDAIEITIFTTQPDIFVPTGFTPNSDGKNDDLKPIPVGISKLDMFNVYNRLGQLVFSTNQIGKGWDGTFNGNVQPSGTYVFIAQGTDYTGKKIIKKGTSVLVR
jgi:gliding motility-associated-like protein